MQISRELKGPHGTKLASLQISGTDFLERAISTSCGSGCFVRKCLTLEGCTLPRWVPVCLFWGHFRGVGAVVVGPVRCCLWCFACVSWDSLCATCSLAGALPGLRRYLGDDWAVVPPPLLRLCHRSLGPCLCGSLSRGALP